MLIGILGINITISTIVRRRLKTIKQICPTRRCGFILETRRGAGKAHCKIADSNLVRQEPNMKINFGVNFTIFILFFGVALLEAFQNAEWLKAAFWLAI